MATTSNEVLVSPSQPLNLPRNDLFAERKDYIKFCVPLHNASLSGDWDAAKKILSERPQLVRFSINELFDTALHIAASSQNTKFVEELVKMMDEKDLELKNKFGNTALCLAAAAGNKKLSEILVNKNRGLLTIPGFEEMMPLYMATLCGNRDTVKYLYDNSSKMTSGNWTRVTQGWVLFRCIEADLFDIALKMLEDNPELARTKGLLLILARKPYAFNDSDPQFCWNTITSCFGVQVKEKESEAMRLLRIIWKNIMELPVRHFNELLRGPAGPVRPDGKETYPSRVLLVAAEMGNTKFLVELIGQCPDLIWDINDNTETIFHIAVSHRHESIYNLLHELGPMKGAVTTQKDGEGNNLLHFLGKNAEKSRFRVASGDAFQMQLELLWYKEIESVMPISYREQKNNAGETPHGLFSEKHKDLVSRGQKWMKATANQCMVVAALIATIVFGVAFSIPGGYDKNNGFPTFIRKRIFIAFVISDAISLIFSSASILFFLSIPTSRYDHRDFFQSIYRKLMVGLATLFLSIVTMMVTFSLSFFVLYHSNLIWVPVVISAVASVPVILYARLHYSLLVDVYQSLYGSRYMFKPKKRMLGNLTPKF